jgi:hypothetical protein
MTEPQKQPNRPLTLLDRWKQHSTRRAEFAALLQEPTMQDAIAIVREKTFDPNTEYPPGVDLIQWRALQGERREGYLAMLKNFLSLANISPFKTQERKAWETVDRAAAIQKLREEAFGGSQDLPAQPAPPSAQPENGPAPVAQSTTGGEPAPVT